MLALGAACGGGKSTSDANGGDGGADERVLVLSSSASRDVDLLFVIDDSASMADKQAQLAASFPAFIQPLEGLVGGLPNLHLGVITTDMGTKGTAVEQPGPPIGVVGQGGCAETGKNGTLVTNTAPVQGTFVVDIAGANGERMRNYTGTLADVFSQMARVGDRGCGFEQPLHAMKVALDNHPANVGFLRETALLAVIVLADEDDCSIKDPAIYTTDPTTFGPLSSFRCTRFGVTCAVGGETESAMNMLGEKQQCRDNVASPYLDQVQPYADFLLGLKGGERSRLVVAGLIGPPTPVIVEDRASPGGGPVQRAVARSCSYSDGQQVADPGVRLHQLFTLFGANPVASSICEIPNGSAAEAGALVASKVGGSCIPVPIADIDPGQVGIQPDCIVEDAVGNTIVEIPPCGDPVEPACWELIVDAARCPAAEHLDLRVVRAAPPDPATVTTVRCRVP